ncbi:MAG: hypothetical protein GY757_03190 [bacterium]|nr:hypothetical protein [bacterium]
MTRAMSKTMILLLLILSLLWTACNKNDPVEYQLVETVAREYPLIITEEKSRSIEYVSKESPIFAKIPGIKDYIYIYILVGQDKNCLVRKYTTDLQLKGEYIIRYGQGPGEMLNPRIYGGDENSIIAFDPMQNKFVRYTTDFKYINEYRERIDRGTFTYSGGTYVPKMNIVIDGYHLFKDFFKGTGRIFVLTISSNGTFPNKKIYETPLISHTNTREKKLFFAKPFHFAYLFDSIYILEKENYRLIKKDLEGNVLIAKEIAFKSKTFDKKLRTQWINKFEKDAFMRTRLELPATLWPASWMMQIGGGIAVGRCQNYDVDEKGPITADYFDPNLNYLGQIKLPNFHLWNNPFHGQVMADSCNYYKDGKLYTLPFNEDTEKCKMIRYKIDENKRPFGDVARMTSEGQNPFR